MSNPVDLFLRQLLRTVLHNFQQGLEGHEGVNEITAQSVGQLAQLAKRYAILSF